MAPEREAVAYRVIDTRLQRQVGKDYSAAARKRARSRAERLNQEWGATRFAVAPVWSH